MATMATTDLQVMVRRRGAVAVLDIVGDIDSTAQAALQAAYDEATAGADAVVLNFARTDYVNSTGIALVVGLLAQARAQSVDLTACGLSDHYREIFEIT